MLLSIGLMVKNESKHLEQCLQSLVPILNTIDSELIIVDTGSTDNTVEIAQRYTKKVYHHEWLDDFSAMRNIVLGYTNGKWFFYLDGDEVVEDPSGIIQFFKSKTYKSFNAAFIEMKNPYSNKNPEYYGVFQALRFFVNDKDFHFKGIVHEQPQAKGPVAKIDGQIVHYGYVGDDKDLMEYKYQRNVALINKVLEKEPENIYHRFQLSQSYAMYGKNKEALEVTEKTYKLAKAKGLSSYMNVVTQLANLRFKNGMFSECEGICQEGLSLKDGYIDLYYLQAMSQVELGKYEESIANFKKYLSLLADYEQGKVVIDLTLAHHTVRQGEQAYLMLCAVYKKLGNDELAIKYGNKVTTPTFAKDATKHLVDLYFKNGRNDGLKELYDTWSHDENMRAIIEGAIENKRVRLEEDEKIELAHLFAEEDTLYGLLNIVRKYISDREMIISDQLWQSINNIDFHKREYYYADLLFVRIIRHEPLVEVLSTLQNDKITRLFMYLLHSHKDFLDILMNLLKDEGSLLHDYKEDSEVLRVKCAALYALLQQEKDLSNEDYMHYFQMYIDVGIAYVEHCYNPKVLDMESISWARVSADGFLFVMRKIQRIDKNSVEYIRYLREALAQDETMEQGIDLLLQEVQEELTSPKLDELSTLKKSIQNAIKEAINAGELETATALIDEYEDVVGIDAPLCSAKGIVYMIDGRLEEAESILLAGIAVEPDNPDLLYNLGYLRESSGSYREAFDYYSKASKFVADPAFRDELNQAFARISPSRMASGHVQSDRTMMRVTIENQTLLMQNLLGGRND